MNMQDRTTAANWQSFSACLPADAPEVQRTEMRRAFYAGAWGLLCDMLAASEPEVSEEEGTDWLEKIRGEIEQFWAELKAGRA